MYKYSLYVFLFSPIEMTVIYMYKNITYKILNKESTLDNTSNNTESDIHEIQFVISSSYRLRCIKYHNGVWWRQYNMRIALSS